MTDRPSADFCTHRGPEVATPHRKVHFEGACRSSTRLSDLTPMDLDLNNAQLSRERCHLGIIHETLYIL
jgi:hypothetical protein